jgi:hypothetical protein
MPDMIILRLHPTKPMPADGANGFRSMLTTLKIQAYDLSFADSTIGQLLGETKGLAKLPTGLADNVDIKKKSIIQHYWKETGGFGIPDRELLTAATAVIVVDNPPAHEFPKPNSFDLRLVITTDNGTREMRFRRLDYNGIVTTSGTPLPKDQIQYTEEFAPTAFVPISGSVDPNAAFELPKDGQPPNFDQLVEAIDRVLKRDPGAPEDSLVAALNAAPITPAQCLHIASELIWNRATYPLPTPDTDTSISNVPFDHLYTDPPFTPPVTPPASPTPLFAKQDIQNGRQMFEANQTAYYATHEVEARQLARYVYAAGAAVAAEKVSATAERARLDFPLIINTKLTGLRGAIAVEKSGGLSPQFIVPAAFFYALGTLLPEQLGPQDRYDLARLTPEDQLLQQFTAAVDAEAIAKSNKPVTIPAAATSVEATQAARRLSALGSAQISLPVVNLTTAAAISPIFNDWLAHAKPSATIDTDFWKPLVAAQPGEYLELVLAAITGNLKVLIDAIKAPPLSVDTVDKLVAVDDAKWTNLFLPPATAGNPAPPPRLDLLPDFTKPGTPAERTAAFIRHLRTFFTVPGTNPGSISASVNTPPTLDRPIRDIFDEFTGRYQAHAPSPFSFDTAPDDAAVSAAVLEVLPGDPAARAWLSAALATIRELWVLTKGVAPASAPNLRFSLVEALYARGFISAAQVAALSAADFEYALTGTVAYPYAIDIYDNADGAGQPVPQPSTSFNPVNPDGSLSDCVPPRHLSPFGPVFYLQQLLRLSSASTCETPFPATEQQTLGDAAESRRGKLSGLHATKANLDVPIPVIDLVNESLECLVTEVTDKVTPLAGAIHDTAADSLDGHRLASDGDVGGDPWKHDPATLFATIPQYSSPATPVAYSGAYETLRTDFTHPTLPYPQALDINRSYTEALGSSRLSVMRHFRRDITEFALDAANEPAEFRSNQWRYPLRLELACEYLGISADECDLLYRHDIADTTTPDRLVLHEVYGYPSANIGDAELARSGSFRSGISGPHGSAVLRLLRAVAQRIRSIHPRPRQRRRGRRRERRDR